MEKEDRQIAAIKRLILLKLIKMGKFGGAHTALRNAIAGLPSRYLATNKGKKFVQKTLKGLVNKTFLLAKGEIHVSINPSKIKEINEFLNKFK